MTQKVSQGMLHEQYATTTELTNLSDVVDTKAPATGSDQYATISRPNRNLIANGSFRVNQQGSISKAAATGWNYDTWYYDDLGPYYYTFVEEADIFDGTFSLSWQGDLTAEYALADATLGGLVGTWANVGTAGEPGQITLTGTSGNNLWIRFSPATDTFEQLDLVQLEVGDVITDFERRPVGQDIDRVIRYYEILSRRNYSGFWLSSTVASVSVHYEHKLSTPSLTAFNTLIQNSGTADSVAFGDISEHGAKLDATRASAARTMWDGAQVLTEITADARPSLPTSE